MTLEVLICRKCVAKLGPDGKALRKAVKQSLKGGFGRDVAFVKTDCFSLCPRDGVVLATARKAADRRLLVLQPGAAVADALGYLLA